jgi:hypothetical protein
MKMFSGWAGLAKATALSLVASLIVLVPAAIPEPAVASGPVKTWDNYYSASPSLILGFSVSPNTAFSIDFPVTGVSGADIDFLDEDFNLLESFSFSNNEFRSTA